MRESKARKPKPSSTSRVSPRTLDSTPKRAKSARPDDGTPSSASEPSPGPSPESDAQDATASSPSSNDDDPEEGAKAVAVSASVVDARPDGARSIGLFGDAMADGNDSDDFDNDVLESEGSVSASSGRKLRE